MTIELLQILAIAAIVLSLAALGMALYAWKSLRGPGAAGRQKLDDEMTSLRTDVESLRDRSRLTEERFERYDRTQAELRDAHDRIREDVEARTARVRSQDSGQKAIQEQIYEIRKELQMVVERSDRQDRRVSEIQAQVSELSTELTAARGDGVKSTW